MHLSTRDLATIARAAGGGTPPAVSPPDFALAAWWKADSFALPDSTRILQSGNVWVDSSGNGNTGTDGGAGTRNPTYRTNQVGSMPAIIPDNDGSDAVIMTNTIDVGTSDWTIAVVFAMTGAPGGFCGLVGGPGTTRLRFFYGEDPAGAGVGRLGMASSSGTVRSNDTVTAAGSVLLGILRMQSGTLDFFENNTARGSNITTPAPGGGTFILQGIMTDFVSFPFWFGKYCECCVWTQSIADADLTSLYNDHFKPRWSLP